MHNLGTVVRFEIIRTLKKKSFWIAALAVPIVAGLVGMIIFFSNKTSDQVSENLAKEKFSVGITDTSGLVSPALIKATETKLVKSEQTGINEVKSGHLDAYVFYPKDLSKDPVRVYAKNVGLFENSKYQTYANQLLQQSTQTSANASVQTVLKDKVNYSVTTYMKNGEIDKGFLNLIAPGMFLILFYFMIATFGNQILTSITEEKENRVIEMILATIKPTTLLVGKLFSLITLALIQMVVILLPIIIGYFILKEQLTLPSIDLSQIPLDPLRITLGAVIFIVSFMLFAGILMTLGAAMPTAKEANGFFGAALAFLFGPLYAAPLFITSPDSIFVQILSYFPLTAPIPLLLRNAVGNLAVWEAVVSIAVLLITTVIVIRIGVRIFKFGALEYSRRLSVKEIVGRKV